MFMPELSDIWRLYEDGREDSLILCSQFYKMCGRQAGLYLWRVPCRFRLQAERHVLLRDRQSIKVNGGEDRIRTGE